MSSLDASKLSVNTVSQRKSYPPNNELVFGRVMTDHILYADWDSEKGWSAPQIKPYEKFELDPSASVLHYAFCCFEGQKAFKDADGEVRVFRPRNNIQRLNRSCARIALPTIDEDAGVELLKKFAAIEKDTIPEGRGVSLYLRPTMISTNAGLGVSPPTSARFFIIASPVGAFHQSPNGVRLKATDEFTRAWPGGTGNAKLGANYAPCIVPQQFAAKEGFNQNLWLYDGYITEVGMMNFFIVFKDPATGKKELTTAPLDGLILEGITRLTLLELARERLDPKEWIITERRVHMDEFKERAKKGEVLETFGAGTAAIVCPVREINYHGEPYEIPTGPDGYGETAKTALKWIQDIQYGVEDHVFCERV